MSLVQTAISYLRPMRLAVQRYWISTHCVAGLIAALSILAGSPAVAVTPRWEQNATRWANPILTDVDVSGPFLQRRARDPHDPRAIERCGEPQIALDPIHPRILIISCMTSWWVNYQSTAPKDYADWSYNDLEKTSPLPEPCHAFISRDGGRSWAHLVPYPMMSRLITNCEDPVVGSGPKGELYLGGDAEHFPADGKDAPVFRPLPGPERIGDVVSTPTEYLGIGFTRSLDGGKTWSSPTIIPTAVDRPFWTVDHSTGTIYDLSGCITGSFDPQTGVGDFGCIPTSRNLAVSPDGGRSWVPLVDLRNKLPPAANLTPGRQHNVGAFFIAAARGIIAVAGIDTTEPPKGPVTPKFKYSVDEGRNFIERSVPVVSSGAACAQTVIFGLAANPKRKGAFAILAACEEVPRALRVYVTEDLGTSWSEVAALAVVPKPDYKGEPSDFNVNRPWIAYGPTGALGVLWRQAYGTLPPGAPRPMAVGNIQYGPQDVFLALAPDGKTFGKPIRLNSAASPPPDPRMFFGDDISSLVLSHDYAYAVWGDWRSGELQSWFRKVPIPRAQGSH